MNRPLVQSGLVHFILLAGLYFNPFFKTNDVIWISPDFLGDEGGGDGRMGRGSGGGGEGITKTGPQASTIGQPVPQPKQTVVPAKPGPIKEEVKASEKWKVKETVKEMPKAVPSKAAEPPNSVARGETTQKEQTNVIRRAPIAGEGTGQGGFITGVEGPGIGIDPFGDGRGLGHGDGVGAGEGSGFGFGGYLKILRRKIWQEWSQSAVFGHKESCVVAMTVHADGNVTDIKIDKTSGNDFYDKGAVRAVRNSSPLPPLPAALGKEQRFRIQFHLEE